MKVFQLAFQYPSQRAAQHTCMLKIISKANPCNINKAQVYNKNGNMILDAYIYVHAYIDKKEREDTEAPLLQGHKV